MRVDASRAARVELSAFTTGIDARNCLSVIGRSGQLEGHGCSDAGSRALLVTLGSAAATAARSAAENARRAMIVQLLGLSESVLPKSLTEAEC